ncbi:MAG TPA: proprotein convertase P-domain-containing protein [Pyrinomonadaceae bacterium]|nr:proprotein convertase P-domain-containing protein [Pyrinomonadaceae bacterium]
MRKYLPHLVVLVTLFTAGYLALAQVQERGPVEARDARAYGVQDGNGPAQQVEEKSGLTDTGVVVNFSKLASKEALAPSVYKKPKVIREPGRARRNKTIQVEGAPAGDDGMEAAAAVGGTEPLAASPAPSSSFKALEDNNTSIPPDTHGAVGPNHLMVTLNTQMRIQTRAGATVSTVSLDSFFAAVPGPWEFGQPGTFDPQVFYDPFSSRWMFVVVADGDAATSAILLAVSQTSDPTGNWKIYKADVDSAGTAWADYPRMGFNKNWIVVTVNMFAVAPATGFKRSSIFVFNKATLYSFAAAASYKVFHDVCSAGASFCAFTQTPALTYDNALNTLYLVEDWDGHTQLRISSITGSPSAPAYSSAHPVTPPVSAANSWTFAPPSGSGFAPQLGSTAKIQTNDSRIQSVVYRNGSLWAAQTIFLPNAATPTRSSVQWWQITPAGAIQQRGRVDDPTGAKFYAFPSIAVNKNNDVLVGYSRFSSQQYASANYAFRAGTDPVNTIGTDVVLKAGAAPYFKDFGGGRNRWGDYSNTVVDPLNDLDLWTIQEHAAAVSGGFSRWGTWWGRIARAPTTPTPNITLSTVTATDGNTADADTLIEPGESNNKLTVRLRNTGNAAATAVSGTLTSLSTGVTIVSGQGTKPYPNLAASTGAGNNATPFLFNVASTYPCGVPISFKLTVTYTGGGSPVTLTFKVPTGKPAAAVTKTRTGTAVAIPDNNATGVSVPLAVSGFTGRISDLNFKIGGTTCTTAVNATTVGLNHTWVGDLVVKLRSPQGTVVTLIDRMGGGDNGGVNFCNTTLDDESAGASIQNTTSTQAPFTGSFKPNSPLSAFDGQNPNGTWTLLVSDQEAVDTGHVRTFSLIITAYACSTTASMSPLEAEQERVLTAMMLPPQLFAAPKSQEQSLAAVLGDAWATTRGEGSALRAFLMPGATPPLRDWCPMDGPLIDGIAQSEAAKQ